ncbi:mMPL family protein [Clostridium sp. CAG:508]|jgi:predicted RND superfamily exporter protein|nr:mMPL family protein [Clostridium sp. CAG:508]
MEKFGQFICKHKVAILIISLLLLIPSIIGYKATRVNYDILVYLPDNIETIKGENILADDFDMGAFSVVILENMQSKDIIELEKQFREVGNVEKVVGLTDIIGTDVPLEMLPDEIKDKLYKDNTTPVLVTFKDGISEDTTMETVEKLREISNENCKISGMTATVLDTRNLSDSEVIIYVMIAVALCLIILQLALDSYLAPVLMLLNIGMAVLYNMGTNAFLGQTSYITKAISAVLQLGVTMDFAIFLYHSYKAEKEKVSNNDEAMATAIAKTLVSVLGSSLTTIAGFLALCSMNLTLGKDIGLVMAKGVLIGVITAVTTLPAMLLVFDKWVEKTKHKEILPRFEKVKNFNLKHYKAILVAFIVILPFAVYGYTHTENYYNLSKSLPDTLNSIQANNELKDKFDMVSTELLLVDKNMPDYKLNEMLDKIESLDGIEWTLSYSKISKEVNIPKEMLPEDITSIFESDKYQMVIINSKYEIATNELNSQIEEVNKIIKEYDDTAILAGEGPLMKDLVEISDHDFNSVNTVSIAIILVIMVFVLKSVSLPIILIAAIEFAIFINMGIPAYTGTVIPFIASIVIGTIQLGATIDYAILITTKYKTARIEGKDKHQAIDEALGTSIQSIIVSALCFFGATFGVGMYSKIEMIGSLCSLMARGAIISMVTVLTVLPAFLIVFDKIICKTTANMRRLSN